MNPFTKYWRKLRRTDELEALQAELATIKVHLMQATPEQQELVRKLEEEQNQRLQDAKLLGETIAGLRDQIADSVKDQREILHCLKQVKTDSVRSPSASAAALKDELENTRQQLEAERAAHEKTKGHVNKLWQFIITRYKAVRQQPPDLRTLLQQTTRK